MAISATHFHLLKRLHADGQLPQGGAILEIGEANVYGDFPPQDIIDILPPEVDVTQPNEFKWARLIYRALFGTVDVVAIDANGPTALKHDLNEPVDLGRQFDTVINHGTAEHVFNIAQVFCTMHNHCKPGGLMIHEAPFTGWVDHGFYSLQPTLFWDVAYVNGYSVVLFAGEHLASRTIIGFGSREEVLEMRRSDRLPDNLMLFVVFRKEADVPFIVPMQGVYAGAVSEQAAAAWRELR